jgi:hypothetical protein
MVSRLVEHKQVDFAVHKHAHPQAAFFPARKIPYKLKDILSWKQVSPKPVPRGLRVFVLLIYQGFQYGAARVVKPDDLRQIRLFDWRAKPRKAHVRLLFSRYYIDQRCFSGPVVANDRYTLPALHQQFIYIDKPFFIIGLRQPLYDKNLVPPEFMPVEFRAHLPVPVRPVCFYRFFGARPYRERLFH